MLSCCIQLDTGLNWFSENGASISIPVIFADPDSSSLPPTQFQASTRSQTLTNSETMYLSPSGKKRNTLMHGVPVMHSKRLMGAPPSLPLSLPWSLLPWCLRVHPSRHSMTDCCIRVLYQMQFRRRWMDGEAWRQMGRIFCRQSVLWRAINSSYHRPTL